MGDDYDPLVQEYDALPAMFAAQVTLVVCGVVYLLLCLGGFAIAAIPLFVGFNSDTAIIFVEGIALVLVGIFMGLWNFATAAGLGIRAKWAWFSALVLGGIYVSSACLPFGAVLLYATLNDRGRKAFLG